MDKLTKQRKEPQKDIDLTESKVVKTVSYRSNNLQKDKHGTATTNGDSMHDMAMAGEPKKGIIKPSTTFSN